MNAVYEQGYLRDRALDAYRTVQAAHEARQVNEQAARDAQYVVELINGWAAVGVVVCPRELQRDARGELYFERDSYRLSWGSVALHRSDEGSLLIFDDVNGQWEWSGSLEGLGHNMADIDARRIEHYVKVDGWKSEFYTAHLTAGCGACRARGGS